MKFKVLVFVSFCMFLFLNNNIYAQVTDQINRIRADEAKVASIIARIDEVKTKVQSSNLYKDLVDGKEVELPLALLKGDNTDYAIYLDSLVIKKDYSYGVLYMAIPYEGQILYFLAKDIRFTKEGGFSGNARLELLKSVRIPFGKKTAAIHFLANGIQNTFVEFDCNGFKKLHIDAELVFDKETMKPENPDGTINLKDSVTMDFSLDVNSLNDYIVVIDQVKKFRIGTLPGYSFLAEGFVFDHSDLQNSNETFFPSIYTNTVTSNVNGGIVMGGSNGKDVSTTWQGFSLKAATVTFPKEFNKGGTERTTVDIKDVLIDKQGFTGQIGVGNILSYDKGEMKGFNMTVDTVYVAFVTNTFMGGGFGGKLDIPLSKKGTKETAKFKYVGGIMKVNDGYSYSAEVELKESLSFDCFKIGNVTLDPGSKINLTLINEKFDASAYLNGKASLSAPMGKGTEVTAFAIIFKGLILKTSKEYLSLDPVTGSIDTDISIPTVSASPISISEIAIKVKNQGQSLGLKISMSANLTGNSSKTSESSSLGGGLSLTIWAKRNLATSKWEFDEVILDKLYIDIKQKGSYSFHGELEFFEGDKFYGTGFAGRLAFELEKPAFKLTATGVFGQKDNIAKTDKFSYWMVDAGLRLPVSVPIPPAFQLNGFYGGVSYHMRYPVTGEAEPTEGYGKTESGATYIPDELSGVGISIGCDFSTSKSEELLNGKIKIFAVLLESGGLDQLGMEGSAQMLDAASIAGALGKLAAASDPTGDTKGDYSGKCILVKWKTVMCIKDEILSGMFAAYLAAPPKKPMIYGSVKEDGMNLAGKIELYVNAKTGIWYFYVGRPDKMNGIVIDIKILKLMVQSYFVMGNQLPNPPIAPMPPEVRVSGKSLADSPLLKMGSGFAFGARLEITGKGNAAVSILGCKLGFYASVKAGVGFDILFIKVNTSQLPNPYCGYDVSDIGINKWYAAGQLFGYASMQVGAKACGYDLNFLDVSAYLALSGQGPSPTIFKGDAGVNIDLPVLGQTGFDFSVTLGDDCDQNEAEGKLGLFSTFSPVKGQMEVDAFSKIKVNLKIPIGGTVKVLQKDGSDLEVRLLNGLITVKATDLKTKVVTAIAGKFEIDPSKKVMYFVPNKPLPGGADITVTASIDCEHASDEVEVYTFTTKAGDYTIPVSNVKYGYPLPSMQNMYKMESDIGFVKLFTEPEYAFRPEPGYVYAIEILNGNSLVTTLNKVTLTENNTRINYKIPTAMLTKSTAYKFRLVKIAAEDTVSKKADLTKANSQGDAKGEILKEKHTLLEYDFTTSAFATFSEKMASFTTLAIKSEPVTRSVTQELKAVSATIEPFSDVELHGYSVDQIITLPPLVKVNAKFSGNRLTALNTIYSASVSSDLKLNTRRDTSLSCPPTNGIKFSSDGTTLTTHFDVVGDVIKDAALAHITLDASLKSSLNFSAGERCDYKVEYYLPGTTSPKANATLSFDVDKELKFID